MCGDRRRRELPLRALPRASHAVCTAPWTRDELPVRRKRMRTRYRLECAHLTALWRCIAWIAHNVWRDISTRLAADRRRCGVGGADDFGLSGVRTPARLSQLLRCA